MNKRGQFEAARKTIYWMVAGVVIAMVVVGFAMVIANYQNQLTKIPPKLQAKLVAYRFINSPDCFAYQDLEISRTFPGVIDHNKYNTGRLNNCYLPVDVGNEKAYDVFNFGMSLDNREKSFIHTKKYYNDDDFKFKFKVIVKEDEKYTEDVLTIWVQEKI